MRNPMSLADLQPKSKAVVRHVNIGGLVSYRLMEMGLVEGAVVEILGRAPFGDPLRVRLGDYRLSIRVADARLVEVVQAADAQR